ncbi:c-type cytochrome domain-containing protein [Horticoccus sp. 23ND18S-11]|uniref:c-type cytochrome domain-containing protein n=1 Tax=Horticoccus sp. 23ND18S-11 TaxID=3391832 RepID=UPI0039C9ECA7
MTAARMMFAGVSSVLLLGVACASEPKKVTYEDDVLPIFRNNCLKCHNPDKQKGDLDLTSFSAAIKGGGSGTTINAGDPDGSALFKSITHADEPTMPPNAKLPDRDIDTIRRWIEGGLLQGAGSKAIAANRPAVDLSLKAGSVGRPDGPPPMPGALPLEPLVRAPRTSALTAIASSPWAPVVALAGAKQIVFYHTSDLDFIGVLPFAEGVACDVKFSRNGKLLLASGGRGGQSGLVAVWDIARGERVITVGDQFDSVLAADISPDQQWIALGGPDRLLKIYATKDGTLEHKKKKHTEWVTAVEFSPDGKYLASGDRNGGLVLWEAESGQEMFTLPGHKGGITAISWRSDSALFLSASEDGTVKWWKASDGSPLRSITAHAGGVLSARFGPDGRIVSSGRDNKVQIWDAAGKVVRTMAFNGELPNRVTFADDGTRVIGSDWKGAVYVWEVKTGKVLGELAANPPTLAERVQHWSDQLSTLKQEIVAAGVARSRADAEVVAAQVAAERIRKSITEVNRTIAQKNDEIRRHAAQLAVMADDAAAQSDLKAARAESVALKARSVALEQEAAAAGKALAAARKQAGEAQAAVGTATAKLEAAKASLSKWQSALQTAKSAERGKVSLR